jgi:hypothetical protein
VAYYLGLVLSSSGSWDVKLVRAIRYSVPSDHNESLRLFTGVREPVCVKDDMLMSGGRPPAVLVGSA